MIIESSNISMFSRRDFLKEYEKKESLRTWVGNQRPDFEGTSRPPADDPPAKVTIASDPTKGKSPQSASDNNSDPFAMSPQDQMKIALVVAMVKALTGKDIKITAPNIPNQNAANNNSEAPPQPPQAADSQVQAKQGWGLEYDYHESYKEQETTSFEADGVIKTQDGEKINFTAQLTMSRQFMLEHNINIREGDAKKIDPLVINFSGSAAQLTDTKYSFDLNSDGKGDKISFVRPGSGFLALDANGDGTVNNGSELFGPSTGSGFAELSKYDRDGNQWIDEKDPVFSRLQIWTKNPDGTDQLSTLADKNIGAIYLGNILTQFEIKNTENKSYGEIKNTGVFVTENGSAGTLQQINLTV